MPEARCKQCGKLLFKGCGTVQIQCPRCKALNEFRPKEKAKA